MCGDPGSGKSTVLEQSRGVLENSQGQGGGMIWLEFREIPNDSVFARRTFESPAWKMWLNSASKLLLVLDGVDEGLLRIPNFVGYLASELRQVPIPRLRLVLVCRSANWPAIEGEQLISLWGHREKPPIFELCPLRQCDAELAAKTWGIDAHEFTQAVYRQSVVALAALPTTLFFLLSEFQGGGAFSGTHRELYEHGCRRLARENDPRRIEAMRSLRKTFRVSTPEEIYDAARQLAALLLLCGKTAINTDPYPGAENEGDLQISDATHNSDVGQDSLTENVAEDAICSGLFTSSGTFRFGFAHHTFAECLAAQYLAGLPLPQVRRLLCSRDSGGEHVVPQLAETAAWLAGMKEDFFDYLCRIEPETLLRSDVSKVQNHRKAELVEAVLKKAKRADLYPDRQASRFFSSLLHSGLANQLRLYILDQTLNTEARIIALRIAGECKVEDLCDDLLRLVGDSAERQDVREYAAYALEDALPSARLADLIPLIAAEEKLDPCDKIRCCVIHRLVPAMWTVSQALTVLKPPRKNIRAGSYGSLLEHYLPRHLKKEDVAPVLDYLQHAGYCFDDLNPFFKIADAALAIALENLSDLWMRRSAIRLWLSNAKKCRSFPQNTESTAISLLQKTELRRREFLGAIVNDPETTTKDLGFLLYPDHHLISPGDLEWALNEIMRAPVDRRNAWGAVIEDLCEPESVSKCWDLFLQRIKEIPELAAKYAWLRAWDLDEPIARQAKARWIRQKRREDDFKRRQRRPNIEALLVTDLVDIAAGQSFRWVNLCYHLSLKNSESFISPLLGHDITNYPGWQVADETRRVAIIACARDFLLKYNDGYTQFGERTNFSDPGFVAVWLLRQEIQQNEDLRAAVAANWINALVGRVSLSNEPRREMAALAYEINPEATISAFIRELKAQDKQHGNVFSTNDYEKAWDACFTKAALELVRTGNLNTRSVESILKFVASISPTDAAACAQELLGSATIADAAKDELTTAVLTACLTTIPATTWTFAWPIIEAKSSV